MPEPSQAKNNRPANADAAGSFLGLGLAIPAAGLLGQLFNSWLMERHFESFPDWMPHVADAAGIESIWAVILALHGAVGAIAPILGYTLLTTAATPAARIAPAGFVVAEVIGWRSYLVQSLALLAGSIAGFCIVPSTFGLAAALLACLYVVFRTFSVFRDGYALLENESAFDVSARNYLKRIVVEAPLAPAIPPGLAWKLREFNRWVDSLPDGGGQYSRRKGAISIGSVDSVSELIGIQTYAHQRLESFARANGFTFTRIDRIPESMQIGRLALLGVARNVVVDGTQSDSSPSEQRTAVPAAEIENIQRYFESLVQFGRGDWSEQQLRIPMLLSRHLSTMIYESISRSMPHDFDYGLEVLGDLIDSLTVADRREERLGRDTHKWVFQIPSIVCRRVVEANGLDLTFSLRLIQFIRGRLRKWLADEEMDGHSRAYIDLLKRLLVSSVLRGKEDIEDAVVFVREVPAFLESGKARGAKLMARALILAFVDPAVVDVRFADSRRVILRTIRDLLRFASFPGGDEDDSLVMPEVGMCLLAVCLFKSREDETYRSHVAQAVEWLSGDFSDDRFRADAVLRLVERVEEIIAFWRLDWWEMDQKERGEAHFMSMSVWLHRSSALVMSKAWWELEALEDASLPNEQTIGVLRRAIQNGDNWQELLPKSAIGELTRLDTALSVVESRRRAIVRLRVAQTALDEGELQSFVQKVADEIRVGYVPYNSWMLECGFVDISPTPRPDKQAWITELIQREWFVDNEVKDIPTSISPPHVVDGMVEFEARQIAESVISSGVAAEEVVTASETGFWNEIGSGLENTESRFLIIGSGIGRHKVWRELNEIEQRLGRDQFNARVRFISISPKSNEGLRSLISIASGNSIVLRRFPIVRDFNADGASFSFPISEGGIDVTLSSITDEEIKNWTSDTDKESIESEIAKFRESLAFRVIWSIEVSTENHDNIRALKISPAAAVSGLN